MFANGLGNWANLWLWQNHSVGNFAAGVIVAVLVSLLWPRLRRAIHAFMDAKMGDLHAKLDHIILHHPDIPPFEKEKQ